MATARLISLIGIIALTRLAIAEETKLRIPSIIGSNLNSTVLSVNASNLSLEISEISTAQIRQAQLRTNNLLKPCITRDQIEKCRSLADKCSPNDREFVIQKWRDKHGGITNCLYLILEGLRQKKANESISDSEEIRLRRLEVVATRFKEAKLERAKTADDITPKK